MTSLLVERPGPLAWAKEVRISVVPSEARVSSRAQRGILIFPKEALYQDPEDPSPDGSG